MGAQERPLRAVEYGEVTRIGSSKPIRVDVRIVAATNEDLPALAEAGRFHAALRARHRFPRYQRELFEAALGRGRPGLARRVAKWVLAQGPNATLARALRELEPGNG